MRRRQFLAGLGSAAAWPLAAGAQQGDRVRRMGVLMPYDESDLNGKTYVSAFTQALTGLGWADGRNVRMDLRWGRMTPIVCERSHRSWSAFNPISS
jgi:putative ABC transport system substrate-binding protein